jgi:hypothetical protein
MKSVLIFVNADFGRKWLQHILRYFTSTYVDILRKTMALMMEVASTSETSVNFYQSARRNISEDSHLQIKLCFISD